MKNKKIYVLMVCLAVALTGCGLNLEKKANAPEVKKEAVVDKVATSSEEVADTTTKRELASSTKESSNNFGEIVKKTETSFLIPEVGIKIIIPGDMTIKSKGTNRRGSFVSYSFGYQNPPSFQEIQFFSKESIQQFIRNCKDEPCFFGDYPDLIRYDGQKKYFYKKEDYKNYIFKKIGNRNYFVSNIDSAGGGGVIREYTTFIDETKIDIWITMTDVSQADAADALLERFEIAE